MSNALYLTMMFAVGAIIFLMLILAFIGRKKTGEVKSVVIWAIIILAVGALILTVYYHGILPGIFGA